MPKWNLEEELERRDIWALRRIVFLDHLKTGYFGVIRASVFAPIFKGIDIPLVCALPIGVAMLFLALMVSFPHLTR